MINHMEKHDVPGKGKKMKKCHKKQIIKKHAKNMMSQGANDKNMLKI